MHFRDKRSDLLVLPALCGVAVSLFAIGSIGSDFIELRSLRKEADIVVESVRDYVEDRIGPGLAFAEDTGRGAMPHSIVVPGVDAMHADLRSVLVLDPQGRVAVPAADPPRLGFGFTSTADFAAFERAIRTATTQYQRSDADGTDSYRTVFYVPLLEAGARAGVIRIDIDQAHDARLLSSTSRAGGILTLALGLIGLSVTILVFWRYIKERWLAEDEIRFLAMHDVLTRLPNRAQFKRRLETALERAEAAGTRLAVIYIDVDNFKDINDTLGHPVGDFILRSTAERILAASGPTSTVARLSGDEFAVLVEDVKSDESLQNAAQRILRTTSIVHEIDGQEIICSISLGISIAPADGNDVDTVMKNADLALYRAKSDGRNTIRFFTADMAQDIQRRRLIENELRRDLGSSNRFKVYYQPQFDLRQGRLIGYEALARWTSPVLGTVSPDAFIPAAESCGLVGQLSEWMLLTACTAATRWPEPTKLAVNLSATQFRSGDVAEAVERILQWTGLPPDRLEIEITETVLLRNTETARAALARLRALGVSVALDDFGTGYSSLGYLSRFSIDKIKIDRSFVQRLTEDRTTAAIVETIVGLGKALDVEIIAEGVETHDQVARLRAIGCHQVQGYLFGAPSETAAFPLPDVLRQRQELLQATG